MLEIAFVILQYGGFQETKRCIESIREKVDTSSYAVVVVDNCSPDSSYEQAQREIEAYADDRFYLLRTEKNLGFANGNNVGIDYVRNQLKAKFVAVINNDTELVSLDICFRLDRKYQETNFAVLGPLILSGDGKYISNPMGMRLFNQSEIDHEIKHSERVLRMNKLGLLPIYLYYKGITSKKQTSKELRHIREDLRDVKIHGCFLVFSPAFFDKMPGFNPKTFLYMEEDILLLEVLNNGMHTLYTPDICIFHKEGATTSNIKEKDKVDFIYTNRLKSQKIYKHLLSGNEMWSNI